MRPVRPHRKFLSIAAFTLLEVAAALGVVAIGTTVAVLSYKGYRNWGQAGMDLADLSTLNQAVEIVRWENPENAALLGGNDTAHHTAVLAAIKTSKNSQLKDYDFNPAILTSTGTGSTFRFTSYQSGSATLSLSEGSPETPPDITAEIDLNDVVLNARGLTGLTGNTANTLDGIATSSLPAGRRLVMGVNGQQLLYELTQGTAPAAEPDIIRPADFDSFANAKVWVLRRFYNTMAGANNLQEITDPAAAQANLNLRSMATQDSNAVNITGGTAVLDAGGLRVGNQLLTYADGRTSVVGALSGGGTSLFEVVPGDSLIGSGILFRSPLGGIDYAIRSSGGQSSLGAGYFSIYDNTNGADRFTIDPTGAARIPGSLRVKSISIDNGLAGDGFTIDGQTLSELFVLKTGDTMTGNLTTSGILNGLGGVQVNGVPVVTQQREIITSSGLTGGGLLSADLTLSLALSGVTPGTYGGSTQVPVITTDEFGRITGVTLQTVTAAGVGGVADDATISFNSGNGVTISPSSALLASSPTFTINTAQDLRQSASPTFASVSSSGVVAGASLRASGLLNATIIGTDAAGNLINAATVLNGYLPLSGGTLTGALNGTSATFTGNVTAPRFISTVATGTAPLSVASTTVVTNLNADLFDGQSNAYYRNADNLNAGTLLPARFPAFTGDATSTVGTTALTLVNTGVVAGAYGSGSSVGIFTVDAKGRLTTAGSAPISIGESQVAGLVGKYLPLSGGTLTGPLSGTSASFSGGVTSSSARISIGALGVSDTDTFLTLYPQVSSSSIYHISNSNGTLRFSRGSVGSEATHDFTLNGSLMAITGAFNAAGVVTGSGLKATGLVNAPLVGTDAAGNLIAVANTSGNYVLKAGDTMTGALNGTRIRASALGNSVGSAAFEAIGAQNQTSALILGQNMVINWRLQNTATTGTFALNDGTTDRFSVTTAGNVAFTGSLTGGTVPWGRLSGHPTISPGTGLSGGGDLSASRTLGLANTTVTAGAYGSASAVGTFTVDAQGRLTAAASTPIAIAESQVTGLTGKYLPLAGGTLTGGLSGTTGSFTGTVLSGSGFLGTASGNTSALIKATGFGYNPTSYPGVQIGGYAGRSLAFGVDVSVIAGGNFTGNAGEWIVPNDWFVRQVDSAGTNFGGPLFRINNGAMSVSVPATFSGAITSSAVVAGSGLKATGLLSKSLVGTDASGNLIDATSVLSGAYLPLTGGTLTGALAGTAASFSGNLSITDNNKFTLGTYLGDTYFIHNTPSTTALELWVQGTKQILFGNGYTQYLPATEATVAGDAAVRIDGGLRVAKRLYVEGNVGLKAGSMLSFNSNMDNASYAIQAATVSSPYDFRFIADADGVTQRKFSFGYYTGNSTSGAWNSAFNLNPITGEATVSGQFNAYNTMFVRSGAVGIQNSNPSAGYSLDVRGNGILAPNGTSSFNALAITANSGSVSPITGALTVVGGIGAGGKIYAGNTIVGTRVTEYADGSFMAASSDPSYRFYSTSGAAEQKFMDMEVYGTSGWRLRKFNDALSTQATLLRVDWSGNVSIPSAQASNSPTDGALAVTGGVGVGGAVNAVGVVSGSGLKATGLVSAPLVGTDASGNLIAVANTSGNYVLKAGDTMTGALRLNEAGGYGRIMGYADSYHGIVLRGTVSGTASPTYAVSDKMEFFEYGGVFNFKQLNPTTNTTLFSVTPTGVVSNVPLNAANISGTLTNTFAASLNSYAMTSPASNSILLSASGNDRDSWIFRDPAGGANNWGIYHRNIDTALSVAGNANLPANSIAFIGLNGLKAYVELSAGNGYFAGSLNAGAITSAGVIAGSGLKATGMVNAPLVGTDASGNLISVANTSSNYVLKAGDTMTGELVIDTNGVNQLKMLSPAGNQGLWARAGYDTDGTATPVASLTNVMFQSSGSSGGTFSFVSGNTKALAIGSAVNSLVPLQQAGNQVLHAGNYGSYALPLAGGSVTGKLWAAYGNTAMAGYSWTNAAFTTNSIEIVNNNAAVTTSAPTLAFHRYGSGGPQFRLDPTGTNVLYLESSNGGSARGASAPGGAYFSKLAITGGLDVSGNTALTGSLTGATASFSGAVAGSGLRATGLVNAPLVGTDASGNLVSATALVSQDGNFGQYSDHTDFSDFNTDPGRWGWSYVKDNAGTVLNSPHAGSQGGYTQLVGLGSAYTRSQYAMQLNIPRSNMSGGSAGYMFMRQKEGGVWDAWAKMKAGAADKLTAARTINITGAVTGSVSTDLSVDPTINVTLNTTTTDARYVQKTGDTMTGALNGTKVTASTTNGQSFFVATQVGSGYAYSGPMFQGVTGNPNSGTNYLLGSARSGELNHRFLVSVDGVLTWGAGTAGGDTNLYRSAANSLRTDDTFTAPQIYVAQNDANALFFTRSAHDTYRVGVAGSQGIYITNVTDGRDEMIFDGAGNVAVSGLLTAPRFASTVATGTAPFTVASTTVVTNLNADLLDGQHSSYFATAAALGNYLPLAGGALTGNLDLAAGKQVAIGGSTANGRSLYTWDGNAYRNPGTHQPALVIRHDNASVGSVNMKPGLVIANNIGDQNVTAGITFAARETTLSGNTVALSGIMGIKTSVGNANAWASGGLILYTKNGGAKVDALSIASDGASTFSGSLSAGSLNNTPIGTTTRRAGYFAGSGFVPTSSAQTGSALRLSSSYGGGIIFEDTGLAGIWTKTNGTELQFGLGSATGLTAAATLTATGFNATAIGQTSAAPGAFNSLKVTTILGASVIGTDASGNIINATTNLDARYVQQAGDTMSGLLRISGPTGTSGGSHLWIDSSNSIGNSSGANVGQVQISPVAGAAGYLAVGRRQSATVTGIGAPLGEFAFNGTGTDMATWSKGANIVAYSQSATWGNGVAALKTDLSFSLHDGTAFSEVLRLSGALSTVHTPLKVFVSSVSGGGGTPANTSLELTSGTNNLLTFSNTADSGTWAGLLFNDNYVAGYVAYKHSPDDRLYLGGINGIKLQVDSNIALGGKTTIVDVSSTGASVTGNLSVSGSISGAISSGQVTTGLGYTPTRAQGSYTNSVISADTRAVNDLPQDRNPGLFVDFKQNSTNGLADGGTYNGTLTFRPYGNAADFTAGYPMQMGFTNNGNLWTRKGASATTWGAWTKVLTQANLTSADITDALGYTPANGGNYLPLAGGTLTGGLIGTTATFSGNATVGGALAANGGSKISVQNQVDGGVSRGIFMWDDTDTNWGIYMGQSGAGKSLSGGAAASGLDARVGHAIRFRVNNSSGQIGFLWENSAESALMQLTPDTGYLYVKGLITGKNGLTIPTGQVSGNFAYPTIHVGNGTGGWGGYAITGNNGTMVMHYGGQGQELRFGRYNANFGTFVANPIVFDLSSGAATFNGKVTAQNFTSTSSIRWKENVQPLKNSLDTVLSLQGVSYDWKKSYSPDGGSDIGFIAEEVGQILPTIVGRDADGRPNSVDYSRVTPVLVEAVKELKASLDGVKGTLDAVRAENITLRSQVASLKGVTARPSLTTILLIANTGVIVFLLLRRRRP